MHVALEPECFVSAGSAIMGDLKKSRMVDEHVPPRERLISHVCKVNSISIHHRLCHDKVWEVEG